MKKNNAGFSLIELLVVVAIMAILMAGVVLTVLSAPSYNVKKAVEQIDDALTETRVQALSKTDAWMEIKYDSTAKKYQIVTSYGSTISLSGKMDIVYTTKDDPTTEVRVDAQPLVLSYDRSSGAFTPLIKDSSLSGTREYYTVSSTEDMYCDTILVKTDTKNYIFTLYKATGRHEVSK